MYCEGISLPKQRDFLEEITKLQKILDIGLKQSKANKKERTPEKEKSLHEVLMEGFREEQKQRELEELEDEEQTPSEQLQDELEPIDD